MKKIKENILLDNNYFKISNDLIIKKDNSNREYLNIQPKSSCGIAVLPIMKNKKILIHKKYKYSIQEYIYQIVKGYSKQTKNPIEFMTKELEEKLCVKGSYYTYLGFCYELPSIINHKTHLYIAHDCYFSDNKISEEKEFLSESITLEINELKKYILSGKIPCLCSQSLILRYLLNQQK